MANSNRYFQFIELQYGKLTDQINEWLQYQYNKAQINFNPASPYGQILAVQKELFLQNILYLKNSFKILDIENSTNKKVIQQTARISGHSPGRAISATGTLKFKLKTGIDYQTEIKSGIITINNNLSLKNRTNSLYYVAKLNTDKNIYPINLPGTQFFIPIIQGKIETQTFTGDGTINQSFSVNIPNSAQIENFNYTITYNSIVLVKKEHLFDMLPKENACYIKSGFNGGIDVYFGTDVNGIVPQLGAIITVEYLLSEGSVGDILVETTNDWKIEGDVYDGQGNLIEIEKFFDITIENSVDFSSDGESIEFTKAVMPYVSRNFVLATPPQFIFHLKRMNIFSKVNAFNMLNDNVYSVTDKVLENSISKLENSITYNKSTDEITANINKLKSIYSKYKTNTNDNTIYLFLIPDITKYFNDNINYFNIAYDAFYLDDIEQNKTLSYLRQLGITTPTTNIKIIQPTITKYIMHVYVRRYYDANEENIKQSIISKTSDYLLNNNRFDRIPKSDFIQLFKEIDGVDSVSLYFVSEKNEDFHAKRISLLQDKNPSRISNFSQKPTKKLSIPNKIIDGVITSSYEDNNELLGLDKVHGDIVVDKDEYAIIRGGFRDREGIWYAESPTDNNLNSINITFDGISENKF